MSWKIAPSKYKNTTAKAPKKEETLFDVPVGVLLMGNNGIQCSASHMAFGIDGEGGKLGLLPIDARGRRQRSEMKIVCAYSEPLNDFTFFPFESTLLATSSREEKLKIWKCDAGEEFGTLEVPDITIDIGMGGGIECLEPHRNASQLIACGTNIHVALVDVDAQKSAIDMEHYFDERADSMSWSMDGKTLVVIGDKGRRGALYDPRAKDSEVDKFDLHSGSGRESRIVFVDDNQFISSGFTAKRSQEVRICDVRKHGGLVYAQEYASSTGILIPLYDVDTKLLFLVGKGTNKLIITEIQEKSPQISPVYNFVMQSQTIGACLGRKFNLDVMTGEVDRVYQLAKNSITPVPCIVPRRSYRDFHYDLFPDTCGATAGNTSQEWLNGANEKVLVWPKRISLDPAKNEVPLFAGEDVRPSSRPRKLSTGEMLDAEADEENEEGHDAEENVSITLFLHACNIVASLVIVTFRKRKGKGKALRKTQVQKFQRKVFGEEVMRMSPNMVLILNFNINFFKVINEFIYLAERSRVKSIVGVVSKYRHVETVPGAAYGSFTNFRHVNTRVPIESNGFCVSAKYGAVPLSRPAGAVTVVDLSNVMKIPDGVIDSLQNETNLSDMMWNPFDPETLACGLDNGEINFWRIENLETPLVQLEPADTLKVSPNIRIILIRYHPTAADIMAVAVHCEEKSLSVWNTETKECLWETGKAHAEGATLAIAWSTDGSKLASVGRDLKICIFKPQSKQSDPVISQQVLDSPRGARLVFACDDTLLVVSHFTKSSSRQITLLNAENLNVLMTKQVDTSSQPLVPHYDFDSNILFLTGKGDRQITMFEIMPTTPYFLQLTTGTFQQGHQAISLQHKSECDIKAVEFMKGWRLTEKTVEKISFRIPRVKKDAFQCDIFPDALVTWAPSITGADWFNGGSGQPFLTDLCPPGLQRGLFLQYNEIADPSPRKRLRHGSERANHTSTEHATADHTTTEQASTEGAGAEDGVEYAAVGENVSVDLRTVRA
uniref:Coronin-7 n=1 Tax=Syphacia muris TaxID=451379 RepID=A0A158R423_9BILA